MLDENGILSDWVINLKKRRLYLAESLVNLVYGDGEWDRAEQELRDNYLADAWDIMLAHPHLLDLEMRTNLAHLGLIKED